jgi:hypothetical protein
MFKCFRRRAGVGCAICVLAAATLASAQTPVVASAGDALEAGVFAPNEPARDYKIGKVIRARRIVSSPPQVDGRLNDEVWTAAEAATGFVQRDPDNGKAMTEDTRIQVAYDSRYLYIAVTCLDSGTVSRGLGRRDEEPPTDIINIGLDPRHDHLTGYIFQTNPSSWQGDRSLFDDTNGDRDFNANWEVRSQVTETGWTSEFRIPFSQLRFTALPAPGQVWGFDVLRRIRRKGETGFWLPRPRGERGDVSRFGHLVFDAPLTPPGRVEFLPYAVSRASVAPVRSEAGTVTGHTSDYGGAIGADVRYGIGPGSTLSATVNPDFGQVEQDPSVLNLSIYETFFPEKRPFFLEDARTFIPPYGLFQVFHSRRIGRRPDRFALRDTDEEVERPGDTTILGAAKLTGKSAGWTYGVLTAETSRERADVRAVADSSGLTARESRLVEPFTSYNVGRVQKDLGGSSNIGLIATGVIREKDDDAFTGGFDYNLRWNRSRDYFDGHWVVTHAPVPDVGMKNGFGGVANVGFNRKHVNGGMHADHFGTDFRVNDIGFLRTRTDRNRVDGNIEIGQPDPGRRLRQYWFGFNGGQSWNHERLVFDRNYETYFVYQFLNFWRGHFGTGRNFERMDDRDTRGGPPIVVPSQQYGFVHFESDSRKSWRWNSNLVWGRSRVGSFFSNWDTGITFQPSDRVQASISASYNQDHQHAQWIDFNRDADGDGVTDYVYGTLSSDVVDLTVRATYAFNRDLTLQAYLQPFVAVGNYYDIRKLARPRSYDFTPVTIDYDPDFNSKSLNSNVVLRWEYVKGSTLFVVWNAGSFDDGRPGRFSAGRDLRTAFGAPANHVFMIKASYWINR